MTLAISDHLAQCLIIQEVTDKTSGINNIYKRDYRNFVLDLFNIEWNQFIPIETNNPNESFNLFFYKIDSLVNQYISLKKLTRKEIKHRITSGIRISMKRGDKVYKIFIKASKCQARI